MNRIEKELILTKAMNQELKDIIKSMRVGLAKLIHEQECKQRSLKECKYSTVSVDTLIYDLKCVESESTIRWAEFKNAQAKQVPSVVLEDF
jgi:hypothetical protein